MDRGAGERFHIGICGTDGCMPVGSASEVGAARRQMGFIRLAIDILASLVSIAVVVLIGRRLRRRLLAKLPYDTTSNAPPDPRRARRIVVATVVLSIVVPAVILGRYPPRMVRSALSPRVPGSGYVGINKCHGAGYATNGDEHYLVTNVAGPEDELGSLEFLVAYDIETGEPHVLRGPYRHDEHQLPALFASVGNRLVVQTESGISILEVGSFREIAGPPIERSFAFIRTGPAGTPHANQVWLGGAMADYYVDVERAVVLGMKERPTPGWAGGMSCWKHPEPMCPEEVTGGSLSAASRVFSNGCLEVVKRDHGMIIQRRRLTSPHEVEWSIVHSWRKHEWQKLTIHDERFYHLEYEGEELQLVARSLVDGKKLWTAHPKGTFSTETPFIAGSWLVLPVSPKEDEYRERYEIYDLENGRLVRELPPS